jgi:parallel beta-helix repeat protein
VLWPGIIVGADGITLNLRGHFVVGAPEPGEGAGILLQGRMTAKVTNGTVRDFDAGVLIDEGGDNTVTAVTARDNIGGADLGHGIAVQSSSDNRIARNTVRNNGPSPASRCT